MDDCPDVVSASNLERTRPTGANVAPAPTPGDATIGPSALARSSSCEGVMLAAGTTIGRYVLLERIGAGAMGVVFRAYDPELDRRIAIKLLRDAHAGCEANEAGAQARIRMLREAQALAQLRHPHVIGVYDVGEWSQGIFIAMELVSGRSLRDWMRAHASDSPQQFLDLMVQAGEGLAAAHARGFVHRDFKPDNVLVDERGRVFVVDFGLVRRETAVSIQADAHASTQTGRDSGPSELLTVIGDVLGTPAYMAPEQHEGVLADDKADQFAFCVTLFEGLYGIRPHPGASLEELYTSIIRGRRNLPPEDTRVAPNLAKLIEKGLSRYPNDRHASMGLLLEQLHAQLRVPPRRVHLWLTAMVLSLGLAIASLMGQPDRTPSCHDGAQRWRRVWNDDRLATASTT